jgi:hypothetical protein
VTHDGRRVKKKRVYLVTRHLSPAPSGASAEGSAPSRADANVTVAGLLPLAKRYNVAAINRGLVQGKSQTHLPWDSWRRPYTGREPDVWFHEVFRTDGTPYRAEETELIKRLTGRGRAAAAAGVR